MVCVLGILRNYPISERAKIAANTAGDHDDDGDGYIRVRSRSVTNALMLMVVVWALYDRTNGGAHGELFRVPGYCVLSFARAECAVQVFFSLFLCILLFEELAH